MLETLEKPFHDHLTLLSGERKGVQLDAWKRFQKVGLPSKKMETYRYVRLGELYNTNSVLSSSHFTPSEIPEADFVFVNGMYRADLSKSPSGLIALPLSKALQTYGAYLNGRFARLTQDEKDPFALLNGVFFQEGLFIYLPPQTQAPTLKIVHLIEEESPHSLMFPRVHIFAGKGSHSKFIFKHVAKAPSVCVNALLDINVEEGGMLDLIGLSQEHEASWHFEAIRATVKERAHFRSFAVTNGGRSSRQDYSIHLQGENCEASLSGVWGLSGQRHHHVNVLMDHQQPHCTSLQNFKGILTDVSRSSFEGKIYVHQKAQKTQAYQRNHNLILGKQASAYTKPNLEIFADDVKASHGATVGQLDEEQLFYLKTRGISDVEARKLLIAGFGREILDAIPDETGRLEALKLLGL